MGTVSGILRYGVVTDDSRILHVFYVQPLRHADAEAARGPGRRREPALQAQLHLVGLALSEAEVRHFYEGFCNATLWPLYHDVIVNPQFHRRWWEAYVRVNRRFAEKAAEYRHELLETIATALFVIVICTVATDDRAPWKGVMAPLLIGLFIFTAAR